MPAKRPARTVLHTATAAAGILQIHPTRVRQLCQQLGVGTKVGRDWILTETEIEQLRARRTTPGRRPSSPQ